MTAKKTTTTKSTPAAPKTLLEAVTAKRVRIVRQRQNGTFRSMPYLAPGSPERKAAELVATRRVKGDTFGVIATDLNLSVATVRRLTEALTLAQQIEAGHHDAKFAPGDRQVVVSTVRTPTEVS